MDSRSGPGRGPGGPVGAVVVGTGPDVAGIGSVADKLLWSPLAGHPLLSWSVRALTQVARIAEVVLLVARGQEAASTQLVETEGNLGPRVTVRAYPDSPGDPVLACLEVLRADCDLVVIHYGNCPLITASSIARGITVAEEAPGSGVVASEPVRETIKRAFGSLVIETPPRVDLVALQSPQIYPRSALMSVYRASPTSAAPPPGGASPASLWLAQGFRLVPFLLHEKDGEGLSVTSEEDLSRAEVSLGWHG